MAETILAVDFRAGLTWCLPGSKDRILKSVVRERGRCPPGRGFPIESVLFGEWLSAGGAGFHAVIHDISERQAVDDAMWLALSWFMGAVAQRPRQSIRSHGRVDYYAMSQSVATMIAEQLGYQVDGVNIGEEAIAAVESTCYDVILMDCTMPVTDGYQTTFRIRQLQGLHRHSR